MNLLVEYIGESIFAADSERGHGGRGVWGGNSAAHPSVPPERSAGGSVSLKMGSCKV